MKYYFLVTVCLICIQSIGQKPNQSGQGNPCIDTVNKKLLFTTWYDVTPNGREEQRGIYIGYFVADPDYGTIPKDYLGTITFKPDGTFIQKYKYNDTEKIMNGT